MDDTLRSALAKDQLVDVTTTRRNSGKPHRFETWLHSLDNQLYLTGRPGPRDWYANMLVQPQITLHLKQGLQVDLRATTIPITAEPERRALLTAILQGGDYWDKLEAWVTESPLVRVELSPSNDSNPLNL